MSNQRSRVIGRLLPSDAGRPCCLLSTQQGLTVPIPGLDLLLRALFPESVVDTVRLDHRFGSNWWAYLTKKEISGIVYTRRGGFIDLAHLRDHIDLTRHYYRALKTCVDRNRPSFSPFHYEGSITLLDEIPPEKVLGVAQRLAYDESIFHEIDTYWGGGFLSVVSLEHKSAFSPEDLVSNFLGVIVGGKVITQLLDPASGTLDFNTAATVELTVLLDSLEAVSKDETYEALSAVEDEWFSFLPVAADLFLPKSWWPGYLQRRNFNWRRIRPWVLPRFLPESPGDEPLWPETVERELPADVRSYYETRYVAQGLDWLSSRFESEIARIEEDAEREHGHDYKDPSPARQID